MYYACAHGHNYLDKSGNRADAWCWLFKYEDLKVNGFNNIKISFINHIMLNNKYILYRYLKTCLTYSICIKMAIVMKTIDISVTQ